MTPNLAALEPIFLQASAEAQRPWPPDPFMKANARLVAVLAHVRQLADDREIVVNEILALHATHAHLKQEGDDLTQRIEAWMVVAEELLRVVAHEAETSPWCGHEVRGDD
jgi:hypothetical protein